MTDDTTRALLSRLKVPLQDLDGLSFCATKAAAVAQWVGSLPMTRISYVSSLLYKALPEVGRLKDLGASTRLNILEALYPAVQQTIAGLSPQFLNQPMILPDTARKAATVAQALQKHLTNAYLGALFDLEQQTTSSEALQAQRALALYRAMNGLGLLLLRSYQLYTPVPSRLWLELHTLYRLAEQWQVCHQPPEPAEPPLTTIQEVYQRLLLLACGRPNQLRQTEVSQMYEALGELAPLARMVAYQSHQLDNLFAVMLDNDSAPLYKSRMPETPGGTLRELDTGPVVAALDEARAALGTRTASTRDRFGLSIALNEHLSRAWLLLAQRSFERRPGKGNMTVTIGLLNLHFHLAGGQPFKLFLNQTDQVEESPMGALFKGQVPTDAPEAPDPRGLAFDAGGSRLAGEKLATFNIEQNIRHRQQQDYRGDHPTHEVPIVDTSPGGYCVEWPHPLPPQLKAGEILGMKEEGRHTWNIGVIRWVQQGRTSTAIGLQTLSPRATPLAAAVTYKAGETSEFLRALELPGLKAVNQPPTLITNAVTFHEYCKVRLYRRNSGQREENTKTQTLVQLTRRRFATGAISQFEYRELVHPGSES